jgi:hypothetical protein
METKREKLYFALETKKQFYFLVERFGFTCVDSSLTLVRFESKKVSIDVRHGLRDYNVEMNFGRLARKEEFSFLFFLMRTNLEFGKSFSAMFATNHDQVKEQLKKLADALLAHGIGIINGDDKIFDAMINVRWWDFHPEALVKNKRPPLANP